MTEEQITLAAREICAEQAQKQDNDDGARYLVGYYDHTVWMRLVEQGIRKGIEQHEAFKQEVSDAVLSAMKVLLEMAEHDCEVRLRPILERFIIPKPDPIAEAWIEATGNTVGMGPLNAALEARGLEIREKD